MANNLRKELFQSTAYKGKSPRKFASNYPSRKAGTSGWKKSRLVSIHIYRNWEEIVESSWKRLKHGKEPCQIQLTDQVNPPNQQCLKAFHQRFKTTCAYNRKWKVLQKMPSTRKRLSHNHRGTNGGKKSRLSCPHISWKEERKEC